MKIRRRSNWRRQEERRREALERQAIYDKLTPEEKLAKLDKFRAKRQRANLRYQIGKE